MAGRKPDRVVMNPLNGTTGNILNEVWANSSPTYRDQVPEYTSSESLVKIGESLASNPGLWNEWLSGIMNKVGLSLIKSATFYNSLAVLQKGEVPFGDLVEEVFVAEAELRDFSVEKAEARELRRSPHKVHSAFHTTNFEGQYATTTEHAYVRNAFHSEQGVLDLISRIISSLANSFNGDDRDLYLYSLNRRFLDGSIKQIEVNWDEENFNQSAKNLSKKIRATARKFTNRSRKYNAAGVLTTSLPEDLFIIIDAETEAEIDVELLASAFNVDRASIAGRIIVIDDWDSIQEDRFEQLREATDNMTELTAAERDYLGSGKLKAVMFDGGLFQVYLKNMAISQTPVHNGMMMNHFLNVFKIYGISPFHNAAAFVTERWSELPEEIVFEVTDKSTNDENVLISLKTENNVLFAMDAENPNNAANKILVMPQGGIAGPAGTTAELSLIAEGEVFTASNLELDAVEVGDTITFVAGSGGPGDDGGDGEG